MQIHIIEIEKGKFPDFDKSRDRVSRMSNDQINSAYRNAGWDKAKNENEIERRRRELYSIIDEIANAWGGDSDFGNGKGFEIRRLEKHIAVVAAGTSSGNMVESVNKLVLFDESGAGRYAGFY